MVFRAIARRLVFVVEGGRGCPLGDEAHLRDGQVSRYDLPALSLQRRGYFGEIEVVLECVLKKERCQL